MIVYSVTVIDIIGDSVLGIRRTPAIFTELSDAISAVKNNDDDLSDDGSYQFAVVEETLLNSIRPEINAGVKLWYRYNAILDEFEDCSIENVPKNIARLSGFGIG